MTRRSRVAGNGLTRRERWPLLALFVLFVLAMVISAGRAEAMTL